MRSDDANRRRGDDDTTAQPSGFYFTRRIDAGHILQVVALTATAAAFGVAIYIFVIGRISDHDGQLLLLKQTVQANKEFIQRVDEAQRGLSVEIRTKIDRVIEMIGDMRERQGGSRPDAPRR